MSKEEKLLQRFLSRPKNFTYEELRKMLKGLGYTESQQGKTSGSRVAFYNETTQHLIRLHKPHPNPELKMYQLDLIREALEERGLI